MPPRHDHEVAAVIGIQIENDEAGGPFVHDELSRLVALQRVTKHAASVVSVACDVGVTPGREKAIHVSSKLQVQSSKLVVKLSCQVRRLSL